MNKYNLKPAIVYRLCCKLLLWAVVLCTVQKASAVVPEAGRDAQIAYYRAAILQNRPMVQFIEYTLAQYKLPLALRNLALIESGFDNKAVSEKGAAGIWQLMPATAADCNLADADRFDTYKSTQAAVRFIASLYQNYQSLPLVVAAYSCGAGRVNQAIEKAGTVNYAVVRSFLPAETITHVDKFFLSCVATSETEIMAANAPMAASARPVKKAKKYGIPVSETEISSGYNLSLVAARLQIPAALVMKLNAGITEALALNGKASLVLPQDKMPDFLLLQYEILNESINTKD